MQDRQIILKPAPEAPRTGWKDAFETMHKNDDDKLLVSDTHDVEAFEWEWITEILIRMSIKHREVILLTRCGKCIDKKERRIMPIFKGINMKIASREKLKSTSWPYLAMGHSIIVL